MYSHIQSVFFSLCQSINTARFIAASTLPAMFIILYFSDEIKKSKLKAFKYFLNR